MLCRQNSQSTTFLEIGGLAFLIPETDGVELPQNMKDTLKDMTELQPMTKKEEPEEWEVA